MHKLAELFFYVFELNIFSQTQIVLVKKNVFSGLDKPPNLVRKHP